MPCPLVRKASATSASSIAPCSGSATTARSAGVPPPTKLVGSSTNRAMDRTIARTERAGSCRAMPAVGP